MCHRQQLTDLRLDAKSLRAWLLSSGQKEKRESGSRRASRKPTAAKLAIVPGGMQAACRNCKVPSICFVLLKLSGPRRYRLGVLI
jgi:hypothetical protein